jgi:hypothetical protein
MTSHELARILLANDDLPIAVHANNNTAFDEGDDEMIVALLQSYLGPHILVGNPWKRDINPPNWEITKTIYGYLP